MVGSRRGEIYGCLIFNNGWKGPEQGHGHGIYAQNKTGEKRLIDNVVFNQFGYGIHCYGTSNAFLRGFRIEGNAGFNNGCLHKKSEHNPAIFVGGGTPVQDLTIFRNFIFGGTMRCGYASDLSNRDVTITENFINGSLSVSNFQKITATGNTIIASDTLVRAEFADEVDASHHDWDRNRYFRTGGIYPPFNWQVRAKEQGGSLEEWRTATHLDAHSEMHANAPSAPSVLVRPNRYEPGRAHIFVFNPGRSGVVDVDLSCVLKAGQKYSIVSAQNPFGPSVCAGVCDGKPIPLPMKPMPAVKPVGMANYDLPVTEPVFGVFVVLPSL